MKTYKSDVNVSKGISRKEYWKKKKHVILYIFFVKKIWINMENNHQFLYVFQYHIKLNLSISCSVEVIVKMCTRKIKYLRTYCDDNNNNHKTTASFIETYNKGFSF